MAAYYALRDSPLIGRLCSDPPRGYSTDCGDVSHSSWHGGECAQPLAAVFFASPGPLKIEAIARPHVGRSAHPADRGKLVSIDAEVVQQILPHVKTEHLTQHN
jgi:hypothetical protein